MGALIVFDKSSYLASDTIFFQVIVDQPMTSEMTVNGTVTPPLGGSLPATSTTTVSGLYGPFTAPGYVVTQSTSDPSQFKAVPAV